MWFFTLFRIIFLRKGLERIGVLLGLSGNGKFSSKRNFILTLFYGEKLKDVLRLADFRLFWEKNGLSTSMCNSILQLFDGEKVGL